MPITGVHIVNFCCKNCNSGGRGVSPLVRAWRVPGAGKPKGIGPYHGVRASDAAATSVFKLASNVYQVSPLSPGRPLNVKMKKSFRKSLFCCGLFCCGLFWPDLFSAAVFSAVGFSGLTSFLLWAFLLWAFLPWVFLA